MRSRTLFPRAPQIRNPNGSIAWTISAPASAAVAAPPVVPPVDPPAPLLPPVNSAIPVITGTATEGQTLTASTGTWTNSPSSYAYVWMRAGTPIGGATASTYLLVTADVGNTITVQVTASNASGAGTPAVSLPTAVVAAAGAVPVNTAVPVITGTATEDETLSASTGSWTNSPSSYTYQWRRGGVDIGGATATTYLLVTADVGSTITVQVIASNASGASAPATSAATAAVAAAPIVGTPMTVTVGAASLDTDERYNSGDTAWSTRSNVLVDDATAATWTNPGSNRGSEMLHVRFAATSIPTDAVVTGIEISARCNNAANASLPLCYLTFDGVVSNSAGYNAQATDLFTGLQTRVFGQDGFTFGSSITPGDLNAGRVGCALRVFRVGAGASTSSMQYVSMKVYYTTLIGKAAKGMSVATVLLPFDATGMATRRVRAAFPVGLGEPSAILFQTMTFDRADFTNYLTRLDTQASVTSSVGCAINGAAVGGWIDINNAGTFAGNTATVHDSRSTPFVGQGGANGDQAVFSNNTSAFAKPVTWGAGYVEFECLGATSPTAGFLTVQAIYADSVHMYVDDGFGTSEANTRVITTGFAANLIIGLTPPDRYNSAVHEAYTGLQFSLAKWDGAAWVNRGLGVVTASRERDSGTGIAGPMTATRNSWELMEDAVYHDWNPNYAGTGVEGTYSVHDYRFGITARSSTTYTIRSYKDQNPGQSNMAFIALDMGSTPFDIGFFDLPTATGAANLPTSYQPSGALIAMTNCTATGRRRDVSDTGAVSFAALSIDGYAVTNGYFSEHGKAAPNPNANSVMDMAGLTMIDVTAATAFQASVTQFNADGIAIDVTTAATGTNKALGLFIG